MTKPSEQRRRYRAIAMRALRAAKIQRQECRQCSAKVERNPRSGELAALCPAHLERDRKRKMKRRRAKRMQSAAGATLMKPPA